jgi:hypothetical protein
VEHVQLLRQPVHWVEVWQDNRAFFAHRKSLKHKDYSARRFKEHAVKTKRFRECVPMQNFEAVDSTTSKSEHCVKWNYEMLSYSSRVQWALKGNVPPDADKTWAFLPT